jgi:hypothetical protein
MSGEPTPQELIAHWHAKATETAAERDRLRAEKAELVGALKPFASIGQWLFARVLPDETPVVEISGINGSKSALTRGQFKAAHSALAATATEGGE